MANHVEFLRQQVGGGSVRAAAQGNTVAVVVTDEEILCGRSGLFGRFGNRVERFPLSRLSALEVLPNPSASLLQLRFAAPDEDRSVLFPASARTALDEVVSVLQACLPGAGGRR
jgi:hypothetical protein